MKRVRTAAAALLLLVAAAAAVWLPLRRGSPLPAEAATEGGSAAVGGAVYAMSCSHCHEPDARGGGCPDLRGMGGAEPAFLAAWLRSPQLVHATSPMPRPTLTPEQIRDVVAFLRSLDTR